MIAQLVTLKLMASNGKKANSTHLKSSMSKIEKKLTKQLLLGLRTHLISLLIRKSGWLNKTKRSTQLGTAIPKSLHTLKEIMPGLMPSTINPMRSSGQKRQTSLLPETSMLLRMVKVHTLDSTQEPQLPLSPKKETDSHICQFNLELLHTTKDLMLGVTLSMINQMKMNGKLIFKPSELII